MRQKMFLGMCVMLTLLLVFTQCRKQRQINEAGFLVPKTVDQDPSLPSVHVNGTQLHAEAFGHPDSAIIVVLHGGPGSDYRYLLNCTEFANRGFRVVFYDQRGAGLSRRYPRSTYSSLQVMYDDLRGIITHYKTSPNQKVFLLGHSWGAMLAAAYLNTLPGGISGAILCEPGGLKWKDVMDYVGRSRSFGIFSEATSDAIYQDQFMTGRGDEHAILDYKLMLFTSGESVGNEEALPFWRSGFVTFDEFLKLGNRESPDWTNNLNQFTTRVLFVYSENNKAYGLAHAQKVSSAFPNVDLFETKGAGHDMLSFNTGWNNTFPVMLNYLNSLK
ncbi:MAG: alpha/beta hydrolase [Sediminibacterium sp.]|nr:alpha/beta hydrolase [Sediminibacterium sp.]